MTRRGRRDQRGLSNDDDEGAARGRGFARLPDGRGQRPCGGDVPGERCDFAGGGIAKGTFTTNDALTEIIDWAITTTASTNSVIIGYGYKPGEFGYAGFNGPEQIVFHGEPTVNGSNILYIGMDKPLTTSGNVVSGAFESEGIRNDRKMVSANGSISVAAAVPEPATWAMMLVGFGMVGATARYRRRRIATVYA